jgi:transcriptional regulator with XRE-family HTH domain
MAIAHPIWQILREQGRNNVWLAKRTGYRYTYVRQMACGAEPVTAEFRRRAAEVLNVPESILSPEPEPASVA